MSGAPIWNPGPQLPVGGAGSGGCGGGCLLSGQAKPLVTGQALAGASGAACCSTPTLALPGTQPACNNPTGHGGAYLPHHQGMAPTGITSVSGPSPLALDYTVDLSIIPAAARVIFVETTYFVSGSNASVHDNGGDAALVGSDYYILWSLGAARAVQGGLGANSAFSIHASASFSGPFGQFTFHQMFVTWAIP